MIEDYFSHRNSAGRFSITAVDDSGPQQKVSVTGHEGEAFTEVPRQQAFGMSGVPPIGSHGHGIAAGGSRDRLHLHAGEDPASRPTGTPPGCNVLYDAKGNMIRLYGSDGLQIKAKEGNVTVEPPNGKKVYLGGDGKSGSYAKVMTESGPSPFVYARIG